MNWSVEPISPQFPTGSGRPSRPVSNQGEMGSSRLCLTVFMCGSNVGQWMPCRLTRFKLTEGPAITLKYFGKSLIKKMAQVLLDPIRCVRFSSQQFTCVCMVAHSNWFALLNMLWSNYSSDFACPESGGQVNFVW